MNRYICPHCGFYITIANYHEGTSDCKLEEDRFSDINALKNYINCTLKEVCIDVLNKVDIPSNDNNKTYNLISICSNLIDELNTVIENIKIDNYKKIKKV